MHKQTSRSGSPEIASLANSRREDNSQMQLLTRLRKSQMVDRLLMYLPEQERMILCLLYGLSDGISYTHKEIATELRMPIRTIKKLEERAILFLSAGCQTGAILLQTCSHHVA